MTTKTEHRRLSIDDLRLKIGVSRQDQSPISKRTITNKLGLTAANKIGYKQR